jgi:hypothetical protein
LRFAASDNEVWRVCDAFSVVFIVGNDEIEARFAGASKSSSSIEYGCWGNRFGGGN